jgi:hypothetical protein
VTAHIAGLPLEEAVLPVLSLLAAARVYVSTRRLNRARRRS